MKEKATLIFFCGKMGAGKSTKAKAVSIEKNAVLLSEDDWLAAHYPNQINSFDDYLKYSARIKPFIRLHVKQILDTGTHVVMDFPANTAKQRAWFKELCEEAACDHALIFLDVCDERCLTQIARRRTEQPERAPFDTEAMFNHVTKFFEPPLEDEGFNIIRMSN